MSPPRSSGGLFSIDGQNIPLSAPGFMGPYNIENWTDRIPSHRYKEPYHHIHLEIDLRGGHEEVPAVPFVRSVLRMLKENQVTESLDLFALVSATLQALSGQGLRLVESWLLIPGGLMPAPGSGESRGKVVERMVHDLRKEDLATVNTARGFHARLGGARDLVADVTMYRIHRERKHALSLDLWGTITREKLGQILNALKIHLPIEKARMTRFSTDRPRR